MSVLINLRQAIIQKISNKTDADVEDMIVGSVDGDERALPGLGVLFELIWKESSPEQQQQYITIIQQHLTKNH
ncbi:small acid-soluble spore protein SspI [Paenibacillus taiwanensis]|uniref:small acid-soluble spore protein SspI n=1 Tax=Paenibacillus taiwanensis TaxID=401638 RepID=UPI0004002F81|nr:small acid-soluble spore protein SspI [Paenibacillus taiwanensis]